MATLKCKDHHLFLVFLLLRNERNFWKLFTLQFSCLVPCPLVSTFEYVFRMTSKWNTKFPTFFFFFLPWWFRKGLKHGSSLDFPVQKSVWTSLARLSWFYITDHHLSLILINPSIFDDDPVHALPQVKAFQGNQQKSVSASVRQQPGNCFL